MSHLGRRLRDALFKMDGCWTTALAGRECAQGAVRVSNGVIYDGSRRVADLQDVVQVTPGDEIVELRFPSRAVRNLAIVGVAVGVTFLIKAILNSGL